MPKKAIIVRRVALAAAVLAAAAAAAFWWSTRPRRWDDVSHPPPPLEKAVERYAAGKRQEAEELARGCLARYDAPAWDARIRVLVAARMALAGEPSAIREVLPRALPPSEPLAAHADLLRAQGLLAAGDVSGAAAAAASAAAARGFPEKDEATRVEAAALEKGGRAAAAVLRLDRETSPALRLEAARVARRAGDLSGARRRLAAVVLDSPPGVDAERALDELCAAYPDPSSRYTAAERARIAPAARRCREAGRLDAALALLRSARKQGSSVAALAPADAVVEADVLVRLGRLAEAEPYVARASRAGGAIASEATYLSAKVALARGRSGAWRAILERLASGAHAPAWRIAALADLARSEEGEPSDAALVAYRRYRSAAGARAEPGLLWREAWCAYDLGRAAEADEGIARVLARSDAPSAIRAAALYWAGRRLEGQGRAAAARDRYREAVSTLPGHYYGMLASRRLGGGEPAVLDQPDAPAREPSSADARRWLAAARALRSVGLDDLAKASYLSSAALAGGDRRAIALEGVDAALDHGSEADAMALLAAAALDRDGVDPASVRLRHLRLLVPLPQVGALVAAARATALDPALVAAVALQESGFNPVAVSAAGARGLLQVLPSTGAELARKAGIAPFGPDRLFEPEVNLRLGCLYLRGLVDRFGSTPVALAAYNAGPSRAPRWRVQGDDAEGERYVERIPFLETRGYVKRILANRRLYRLAWRDELPSGAR